LEIGIFEGGGSVSAKFSRRRRHPPATIFVRLDRPINVVQLFSLTVFKQRKSVADFKRSLRAPPPWELGGTYDVHLKAAYWKARSGLPGYISLAECINVSSTTFTEQGLKATEFGEITQNTRPLRSSR